MWNKLLEWALIGVVLFLNARQLGTRVGPVILFKANYSTPSTTDEGGVVGAIVPM